MSRAQCGDVTCRCCHPDLTCDCLNGRPEDADPGTVWACPACGATMVARPFRDSPGYAITAPLLAKHRVPEPRLSWQRLTPATRIPGALA